MVFKVMAWWFKRKGWRLGPNIPPNIKKCVVVAAPHTSNWDFVYSMAALYLFGQKIRYLAKKELFRFPLKWILKSTGAIQVVRNKNTGMVDAIVNIMDANDEMVLMIAGEGTRGKVDRWKSGLHHVALKAGVPIMPAYLDYGKKEAGFGEPIYPTHNMDETAAALKAFYADKQAKYPENFNIETIRF